MKSPFPGMDPYLEDRWPEVHARLIVYASNQINAQLPDDLQANIEENLTVYDEREPVGSMRPDVHIQEQLAFPSTGGALADVAVAEPLRVKRAPRPDRHVEIVDRHGRIVTAIEFLSPWNKVGIKARERYVRKQMDYLDAGVNLVEIDLVRQGEYVLAAPLDEIPEPRRTPYMVCVSRGITPNEMEVYPISLKDRLPNIPIPLRPSDADVVLQLQVLLDECYRDGRYYRIDYHAPTRGRFDPEDTAWIESTLREASR